MSQDKLTWLPRLDKPKEYINKDYDRFFDVIYEEDNYFLIERIDPSDKEFFIEISDIECICKDMSIRWDVHKICEYAHEPIIELLTKERLSNDIYAKIDTSNIRVYKGLDDKYYTHEKTDINKLTLINMRSLKDYILEQEIYEGILNTWNSKTFKQKLQDFLGIYKDEITVLHPNRETSQIEINIKNIQINDDNECFIRYLANMSGYTYNINEDKIIFTPYHPDNANHIIKKNKDIVYHLTTKYFYDKIKDKEHIPLRSNVPFDNEHNKKDQSKDRLFCYCGDLRDLKLEIESFRRTSARAIKTDKLSKYYDKDLLLVIDISKTDKKLDWYYDPHYKIGGGNAYAVFTNNYIPTECIIETKKIEQGRLKL